MPGRRKRWVGAPALALAITAIAVPAAAADFAPGAAGVGDPFFPKAGNGGYDVVGYDLTLRYQPKPRRLTATAIVTATATQDLSSFDLDYRGPEIKALTVDGTPAQFSRDGQELIITPASGIPTGASFKTEVSYSGVAKNIKDADGALDGWIHTDDGVTALGEPQGSPTWFPCNDTPVDKATFRISIRVPRKLKAISNGRLASHDKGSGTWSWVAPQPMATYLATVSIGRFRLERSRAAGVRSIVAVDPREARQSKRPLRAIPGILKLFSRIYGPYPFGQVGAIVDHAPKVGYALETQTRPTFDAAPNAVLLSHELAHQYFGDSVSLTTWPDIWLNEGFATWSQWRYAQETGGATTAHRLKRLQSTPPSEVALWSPPPGAVPGPKDLFATSIYVRGAMALEALRQRVGKRDFYATMRAWVAAHRNSDATIDDFISLAESTSGEQLDQLFQRYLYKPGKP
jgi:aminopeptidase N